MTAELKVAKHYHRDVVKADIVTADTVTLDITAVTNLVIGL